jgi:hypothetical protein
MNYVVEYDTIEIAVHLAALALLRTTHGRMRTQFFFANVVFVVSYGFTKRWATRGYGSRLCPSVWLGGASDADLGLPLPKGGSVANLGGSRRIAHALTGDAPKHDVSSSAGPSRLLANYYDVASRIIHSFLKQQGCCQGTGPPPTRLPTGTSGH